MVVHAATSTSWPLRGAWDGAGTLMDLEADLDGSQLRVVVLGLYASPILSTPAKRLRCIQLSGGLTHQLGECQPLGLHGLTQGLCHVAARL